MGVVGSISSYGDTVATVTKLVRGDREHREARTTIKGYSPLSETFDKNEKRDAVNWVQLQMIEM